VSSEFELGSLTLPYTELFEPADADDRVMHTAGDRPSPSEASLPALADPAADHLDPQLAERRAEVEAKHQRVIAWLDATGYDAVILGRADSLAWFTCGGEMGQTMAGEAASALLFVNRQCRAILCDNVQSARIFEEEVAGLGFQLKERPWYDNPSRLACELGRGRRMAGDGLVPCTTDERAGLLALRWPLGRLERQRLRELGRALTLAIEATCRNFQPGETEADLAGHLAHRLLREGITPLDIRVAGDDRPARFRQPTFKAAEIHKRATLSAVGRRHGLCASASRSVSFGPIDREYREAHGLVAMVEATFITFSRPGQTVADVFRRARRIYEKYGHPDEWTLNYQGWLLGYHPRQAMLLPDGPMILTHGLPLCWCPSVGAARSEDTIVVDDRGIEVVTEAQRWPKLEVTVKGYPIQRPGVLER
jgi:Xaa-Pro aminopeptidase